MPRRAHRQKRSRTEINKIGDFYKGNSLSIREICERFDATPGEIQCLKEREGWPARGHASKPIGFKGVQPKIANPFDLAAYAAAARRADAERDAKLYGAALDDVNLLRRRGFAVTREGQYVRVGNDLITLAELRGKAARERRLLESVSTAASLPSGEPSRPRPARGAR